MKFDVFNRFSGAVQFTTEIDCAEDAERSVKVGLAVKWAVKTRASLDGASLDGANLNGAILYRASLEGASLEGASLNRASLDGANLNGANLNGASLDGANLNGANLNGASLYRASFNRASLYRASFNRASLDRASLDGASLDGANLNGAILYRASFNRSSLDGASLDGANGVNDYVKCIQIETYPITYTSDVMQIGCQRHPIEEWRQFDDERILQMDGKSALKFWRKYKDWIFQTIYLCPAKPTNASGPNEARE